MAFLSQKKKLFLVVVLTLQLGFSLRLGEKRRTTTKLPHQLSKSFAEKEEIEETLGNEEMNEFESLQRIYEDLDINDIMNDFLYDPKEGSTLNISESLLANTTTNQSQNSEELKKAEKPKRELKNNSILESGENKKLNHPEELKEKEMKESGKEKEELRKKEDESDMNMGEYLESSLRKSFESITEEEIIKPVRVEEQMSVEEIETDISIEADLAKDNYVTNLISNQQLIQLGLNPKHYSTHDRQTIALILALY